MVKRLRQKKIPGNSSDRVDRDMLHQHLWQTKDRYGYMTYQSKELAERLGISVYHMSRILSELQEQGKIQRISGGRGLKWKVIDPTITQWSS